MDNFRRHRAWCPRGRPPGRRRLDLATDYGAFPVWEWTLLPPGPGRPGHEVHANVGPGHLGLSIDLTAALRTWADWPDRHQRTVQAGPDQSPATAEDWRRWRDEGADLAERLAAETGAEVVYQAAAPEPAADCPECGAGGPAPAA